MTSGPPLSFGLYACTEWTQSIAAGAAAAYCPATTGVTISTSTSACAAPGTGGGKCTATYAAASGSYTRTTVFYPTYPGGMAAQKTGCAAAASATVTMSWIDG